MDGAEHRARAPKPAATKNPTARKAKHGRRAADTVAPADVSNAFAARAIPGLLAPQSPPSPTDEWLETDGLGGFASGTVSGIRTRRYHALLLAATTPPTGRYVLVNGLEQRGVTPNGTYDLSSQRYAPDVVHPDGHRRVESFTASAWPVNRLDLYRLKGPLPAPPPMDLMFPSFTSRVFRGIEPVRAGQ